MSPATFNGLDLLIVIGLIAFYLSLALAARRRR
jgi:hypothetical protein